MHLGVTLKGFNPRQTLQPARHWVTASARHVVSALDTKGGKRSIAASAKNLSLDNRNKNNDGVQALALIGAEVSCSDL